jgi:hypothetical protein
MVMDHLDQGAGDAGAQAEAAALQVLFLHGRILLGKGQYCEAERTLGQAAAAASGAGDAQLTFEVRHTLFYVLWVQGRYRDAGPIADELTRQAEASGREDQLCQAKLAAAYYNVVLGDLSASTRLAAAAAEHARTFGHPYREVDSLILLGSAQESVGLYDEALGSLRAARELAERLKTAHHRASVQALLARVHHGRGELEAAISGYGAAMESAQSLSDFRTRIGALAGRARALSLPGATQDLERARVDARKALALAEDHAPPSEAEARLALVELHLAAAEPGEALAHAQAAVEVLDRLGTQERFEVEILLAAADALRGARQHDAAEALRRRAREAVQKRAEQISEPAIRARFLGVAYNARAARSPC